MTSPGDMGTPEEDDPIAPIVDAERSDEGSEFAEPEDAHLAETPEESVSVIPPTT